MTKQHFSANSTSICGHEEMTSFTYGSKSARLSDQLYAANTLCMECASKLKELVAPVEKGFFKLQLPTLVGSPRSVSYANTLRIKLLRIIGPIMAKLDKSDEPLAKAALAVYKMLFKITEAKHWIECKDAPYDRAWMGFEIASLMRNGVTSSVRTSPTSAHEYWRIRDASVIAIAAESLAFHPMLISQPPQVSNMTSEAGA